MNGVQSWPTPLASDSLQATMKPESLLKHVENLVARGSSLPSSIQLTAAREFTNWPTPLASDALKRQFSQKALATKKRFVEENKLGGVSGIQEMAAVEFAKWPTPLASQAFHARFSPEQIAADVSKKRLPDAKWKMAAGVYSHSTEVAAVEFGLRPNSLLSLWLMNFPRSWLD